MSSSVVRPAPTSAAASRLAGSWISATIRGPSSPPLSALWVSASRVLMTAESGSSESRGQEDHRTGGLVTAQPEVVEVHRRPGPADDPGAAALGDLDLELVLH